MDATKLSGLVAPHILKSTCRRLSCSVIHSLLLVWHYHIMWREIAWLSTKVQPYSVRGTDQKVVVGRCVGWYHGGVWFVGLHYYSKKPCLSVQFGLG